MGEVHGGEEVQGARGDREGEASGELGCPQGSERVIAESLYIRGPQDPKEKVIHPVEGIEELPGERVQGHGVDGEVPAPSSLFDAHPWIAIDLEVFVTGPNFAISPGDGEVVLWILVELEDLERGSYEIEGPKALQDLDYNRGLEPIDLDVEVLGLEAESSVSNRPTY
jgi:hypothetical protein